MLHIKLKGSEHRKPWKNILINAFFLTLTFWPHPIFCPYTQPWVPRVGSKGQSKEQIKDQELMDASTTPDPGHHMGKWKTFLFLKTVMLYIKLKEMGQRAPHKHTFWPFTHPPPMGLGQKVNTFFSETIVMLKIKQRELSIQNHTCTNSPSGEVLRSKLHFFWMSCCISN